MKLARVRVRVRVLYIKKTKKKRPRRGAFPLIGRVKIHPYFLKYLIYVILNLNELALHHIVELVEALASIKYGGEDLSLILSGLLEFFPIVLE